MAYGIGEAPEKRTVNGFFCTGCNSLLISLYTHDYKVCDCGNMVDGGSSYVRRGYKDFESFKKVIEIFDWAGILVAAEIGFTDTLTEGCGLTNPLIQELIKQDRLIFTADAKEPEAGEQELGLTVMDEYEGDGFCHEVHNRIDEELIKAQAEKDAKDRTVAAKLFRAIDDLSLGESDDPEIS